MISGLPNESMMNLLFRLKHKSVELKRPDPPIIAEKGVTIIDWNQSESDAVNRYLNRLIRLQVTKYFEAKDEESKNDRTAADRLPNRSHLRVVEKQLEDEPLVSVFDGFGKFTESVELIEEQGERTKRRSAITCVERLVEPDDLLFYLTLRNYFADQSDQFNQIKNRLLVIVFMNNAYFEKFLDTLAGRELYFHLVIVTYASHDNALRDVLRKNTDKFQSLGYLQINNSPDSAASLEIKAYDKNRCKAVSHFVDL